MNNNKIIFRLTITILIINYALFVSMYYSYNQRMMGSQSSEMLEQIQESHRLRKQDSKVFYKTEYGTDRIYFALYNNIESNNYTNYDETYGEYIPAEHNKNDIFIIDDLYDDINTFEREGYKLIKNGRYNLYYK